VFIYRIQEDNNYFITI